MNTTAAVSELDLTLDVFGQRLVPVFTQISFCFAIPDDNRVGDIPGIRARGAERLAGHFPWVAGQVVCEGATEASTGCFKIKSFESKPRVWVKDLRDEPSCPSWDVLQRSNFPMDALDESIVAPRKTVAEQNDSGTAEVFQLQATIVKGGMVLTFLGQHQVMDGTGQAQAIALFSKACRNEAFTREELRVGNLAPKNVVEVLGDSWAPGPELEYNIVKQNESEPGPGRVQDPMPTELGIWACFNFSASALQELKSLATQTLPPNSGYITTDDALTGFVWRSIARARLPRYSSATEALFARAVDLRRYLGISGDHPGFVQDMAHHSFGMGHLADSPLGVIAANLRAAVDPRTSALAYHGRSLATLISRTPDKRSVSFLAGYDPARDVMLSSWASQNAYQLDFGLRLGRPRAVRRPRFDSLPGLVYCLPKSLDGGVDVAVCLSADDMDRLGADAGLLESATYIG